MILLTVRINLLEFLMELLAGLIADGISNLLAVLMKLSAMLMELSDVLMSCHNIGNYWLR